MKCTFLLMALGAAVALAAPERKVEVTGELADIGIDGYATDRQASGFERSKSAGTIDANFAPLSASSKFKARAAALKAQNGVASVTGSEGKTVQARKTGAGQGTAVHGGNTATGRRQGDKLTGSGNGADGSADITKTGKGRAVRLEGEAKGAGKVLDVNTDKAEQIYRAEQAGAQADLASATKAGATGTVGLDGKPSYDFGTKNTQAEQEIDFHLTDETPGRSGLAWKCTAVKSGESTCVDAQGNRVGRVIVDDKKNVMVYNKRGLPIARGKAVKGADGSYSVQLTNKDTNTGLATATVGDFTRGSCLAKVSGPGITKARKAVRTGVKSVHLEYNGKKLEDGMSIKFPDCFDVVSTVELERGVKVADLALEVDVNVTPLGKLSCLDDRTDSSKGCYYSTVCDASDNKDGSVRTHDACDKRGGSRPIQLRTTVCPPREDTKSVACSRFDRSIVQQLSAIDAKSIKASVLLWQRSRSEAIAQRTWATAQRNPRLGKAAMSAAGLLYSSRTGGDFSKVDDLTKYTYFMRAATREKLVDCQEGVMNYNVGGEKVDSNALLRIVQTGADAKGNKLDIFDAEPCDAWVEHADEKYANVLEANQPGKLETAFTGLLGRLG